MTGRCDPYGSAALAVRRRPLSPTQDRVLTALCLYTHRHRRQPSYSELAKAVGVGSVQRYLLELEVKGWIRGAAGRPRAIEIPADVYQSVIDTGETPKCGPGEERPE